MWKTFLGEIESFSIDFVGPFKTPDHLGRRYINGRAMNTWKFANKLFIEWIKDQKVLTQMVSGEVDRELRCKGLTSSFQA